MENNNNELNIGKLNERIKEVCENETQQFVEETTNYIQESLKNGSVFNIEECAISNESIKKAVEEAIERSKLYIAHELSQAKILKDKYGIEPYLCKNSVCEFCNDNVCVDSGNPTGCLYRMIERPINSLFYNEEYIPTHKQALDMLEKHNLLKGERQEFLEANINFKKASSREERNKTEINGINFSQLNYCVKRAVEYEINTNKNDGCLNIEDIRPDWIAKEVCLSIEKVMGIYPNIKMFD